MPSPSPMPWKLSIYEETLKECAEFKGSGEELVGKLKMAGAFFILQVPSLSFHFRLPNKTWIEFSEVYMAQKYVACEWERVVFERMNGERVNESA